MRDAKTGDDLTRSILLQIILEEETGGVPMFSHADAGADHPLLRPRDAGDDGLLPREEPADLHRHAAPPHRAVARACYDPKAITPEVWTQFLNGQAPLMQGLMGNYLEQSKNLFVQMQEQMAKQAGACSPACRASPPPKR